MTYSTAAKFSAGYETKNSVGENKTQDVMYDENVRKLKFKFDINKLKEALDQVLAIADVDRTNQISLTHAPSYKKHPDGPYYQGNASLAYEYVARPANKGLGIDRKLREKFLFERAFCEFIPTLKHTYFYHVYKELSTEYNLGRMRIMKLIPTQCYTWHMDVTEHLHVPIHSNPGNKLVIGDNTYYLPADGSSYITDTTKFHTAFNGGMEDRFNILINLRDTLDSDEIETTRSRWIYDKDVIRYRFHKT